MKHSLNLIILILILGFTASSNLAQNPTTATGWYELGNKQLSHNNYQQAVESYTKSLELLPGNYKPRFNRGAAYYKLKKYDQAIQDYDQVLKFKPFHALSFYNRGLAFQEINEHSKAISDFTYATTFDSKKSDGFFARSISYCKKGEINLARADERKVIQLGGRISNPCGVAEEKAYSTKDEWKTFHLNGTGVVIKSPKTFELLQAKPTGLDKDQFAYVLWATDFYGVGATVSYEKRRDSEPLLDKIHFAKRLFVERYRAASSEIFVTDHTNGYTVHLTGKYTDPKTGKLMAIALQIFGGSGEYYTVSISYEASDPRIAGIAELMNSSVRKSSTTAKAESNEPVANWTSLTFKGLSFQTPGTRQDPKCSSRHNKNNIHFAQTFYCYEWNNLTLDVGYGKSNLATSRTPGEAATRQKAAYFLSEDDSSTVVKNTYTTTELNISGAEAVLLKKVMDAGLASIITEIVYIKRGTDHWEIAVTYDGDEQSQISAADRIIKSLSIK